VVIGGAEGGLRDTATAEELATDGFPALALAYFGEPELPRTRERIPLEYFARAARWLGHQPGVDPRGVAILGSSRGGEAALVAAATFPRLFHAAIGLVPSSYLYPGYPPTGSAWTLRGQTLPVGMDVPATKIRGPVLVAGSGRDEVWDSGPAVKRIAAELRDAHFPYRHRELYFTKAGHGVGRAIPLAPSGPDDLAKASAEARAGLWPAILSFLRDLRRP
jgi:dienelactone hydrolase